MGWPHRKREERGKDRIRNAEGFGRKVKDTGIAAKSSVRTRLCAGERWGPGPPCAQTQSRGKAKETQAVDFDLAAISR